MSDLDGGSGAGYVNSGVPRMSVTDGFDYVMNTSRLQFNNLLLNYTNEEDPRIFYFTLGIISQIPDKNRRKELKDTLLKCIGKNKINSEKAVMACIECIGNITDWQDNYRAIVSVNYTGDD